MDLAKGSSNEIASIYDLVGAQVKVQIDGAEQTLDSPWPDDPGALQQFLPELFDKLAVSSDEAIEGRININQARREVLLGIPGMTEELADGIVNSRMIGPGGEPLTDTIATHATTGWLLTEGLVDIEQMRALDPYITTRGDVYRVQAVGYFDAGGPVTRVEAVIDGSQIPPRIISYRDLTHLGQGQLRRWLQISAGATDATR